MIPKYLLFQEVKKKGFDVVLTASAANEAFGGYRRQKDLDCQEHDVNGELTYYHFPSKAL